MKSEKTSAALINCNKKRIAFLSKICLSLMAFLFYQNTLFCQTITHGPMIGGITESSARIYIRTSLPTEISIEYSQDSLFSTFLSVEKSTTEPLDNSTIFNISNLAAFSDYFIRFKIGGNIQGTNGHFKTFPMEASAEHLVIVTGSCQETENMKVFDVMPTYQPNLFIHTGDFTYPSYQIPRYYGLDYPTDYNAVKLGWLKRNEEPICKEMLKKIPIAFMPDDDDTWGNSRFFKGGEAKIKTVNGRLVNYFDLNPRTATMRSNCLNAYTSFFPGYPLENDTNGYYHSFKMGNCEFFMIDVRSANTGGWNNLKYNETLNWWSFNGGNSRQSILGELQLNWFLSAIKNSTATWKFIVSGVPFNKNIQKLVEAPLLLQGVEFDIAGQQGTGFRMSYSFSDYFGAYAYERTKILNFIKDNDLKNVIVISGDTHGCAIDDGKNAGLPEMNASGLSVSSTELYYQFDNILSALNLDLEKWLWNKGGLGINNSNTKNAFGKIEVFGNDSVSLCIIDEDNIAIACHTILSNSGTTGLNNSEILNDLVKIFPNPASQFITIQLNDSYLSEKIENLKIIDNLGKILMDLNIDNFKSTIQLPISNLGVGTYLLVAQSNDKLSIQQFIKK
jgi:alkaline phosphatase D